MDELSIDFKQLKMKSGFVVDQTVEAKDCVNVTKIQLNFYQLWYLFGELPCVYEKGKSGLLQGLKSYEYKIVSSNKCVFSLYAWATKGLFLKESTWYVGCSNPNEVNVREFLEYLLRALEHYRRNYKCIERKIFNSDNPIVDNRLKVMKIELIKNRETLKTL